MPYECNQLHKEPQTTQLTSDKTVKYETQIIVTNLTKQWDNFFFFFMHLSSKNHHHHKKKKEKKKV